MILKIKWPQTTGKNMVKPETSFSERSDKATLDKWPHTNSIRLKSLKQNNKDNRQSDWG